MQFTKASCSLHRLSRASNTLWTAPNRAVMRLPEWDRPFALQSHASAMAVAPRVKGYIREGKGTGKGRYENNSIGKREDQTTGQENGTARLFHLRL